MGRWKTGREHGGFSPRVVAAILAVALGASLPLSGSPANAATFSPPPIRHVWVIMLENSGYATNFTDGSSDPYLSRVAVTQGVTIPNYYGIGHESLDNYIAFASGQAPNPQTQDDCGSRTEFTDSGATAFGQHAGQGCVFTPTSRRSSTS
jgi:hypothetical protein